MTLQSESGASGPLRIPVISWSKVPENSLETQAGMLGSQGSGLIYLCIFYP